MEIPIIQFLIWIIFCLNRFAGVRELFEQEPMPVPKKSRAELMKDIDADYYGYRDDDDGILIPLEQEAEKEGKPLVASKFRSIILNF